MTERELDEILTFHWPVVLRRLMAGADEWGKGFARSIARHGKRPTWHPTEKQERLMRRMVAELGTVPDEEPVLVE